MSFDTILVALVMGGYTVGFIAIGAYSLGKRSRGYR